MSGWTFGANVGTFVVGYVVGVIVARRRSGTARRRVTIVVDDGDDTRSS